MDFENITELDLSNKGLNELPDLSKYTNLKKLNCQGNCIARLDNLPPGLQKLNCCYNPFIYNFEPTLENIRNHNSRI